jgi:raffinose/stachyose/melibiose transport system permease protein
VSASVPATARRRQRRRRSPAAALARWSIVGGLTCFALSALFPLAFMAVTAFRSEKDWDASKLGLPTTFSFGSFERAWSGATISTYFRNSAIVTLGTVLLTVICATLAGYSFSKLRWRGSGAVYFFVLAWIAIPPLLLIVPVYVEIVNLGLLDTYWSVILLYTALNLPFNVYLMAAFFRSLPDELLEAARIDGATEFQVFRRIIIPSILPTIVVVTTYMVINAMKVFDIVFVMGNAEANHTEVVAERMIRWFFIQSNDGRGAAIAVILFLAVIPVMVWNVRQFRNQEAIR